MDPITAVAIGGGLSGLGGLLGGRSQAKAQERANRENLRMQAITNLVRLAGGQPPGSAPAQQPAPKMGTSNALNAMGQAFMQYAQLVSLGEGKGGAKGGAKGEVDATYAEDIYKDLYDASNWGGVPFPYGKN